MAINMVSDRKRGLSEVLKEVQGYISENHSTFKLNDKKAESIQLKNYITKYIIDNGYSVDGFSANGLIDRLYQEMAEFGFLTPYLFSTEVEEININSWEDIKIKMSGGEEISSKETFNSPSHALDVIRRLLQTSDMVLDYSNPVVRGHLVTAGNVRITALAPPIIDKEVGVSSSIRIVNPKQLDLEDFINFGTATKEILDSLKYLMRYGVSIGVAGSTNSGKTTLLDGLTRTIPNEQRIFTIENNVREFSLVKKDKEGNVLNSVVHTVTKDSENELENIDQEDLLEYALTCNPDIIIVGEMKSAEAFSAQEAARTGHVVLTTTHANSCEATYRRMMSLCKLKYDMKDETLYDLVTEAFPIIVFVKHLEDGSRKVMEVTECEILPDGKRKIHTLFSFDIEDTRVIDGKKKIIGSFKKVQSISDELKKRLLENGMSKQLIDEIF